MKLLLFVLFPFVLSIGCTSSSIGDETSTGADQHASPSKWIWAHQPPIDGASIIEPRYAETVIGPNGNIFFLTTLTTLRNGEGENRLHLACYTPGGKQLWVKEYPGLVVAHSLSIDSQGNLWTAGTFKETLNLSGHRITSGEEPTWMLAKFSAKNGSCKMAIQGEGHRSFVFGRMGTNDQFWVAGNHKGMMPQNSNEWLNGRVTVGFLQCFDADGRKLWVQDVGTNDFVRVNQMRPLPGGSMVIGGTFEGKVKIGDKELSAPGMEQEGFVGRIEGDGSVAWLKQIGSMDSESYTTSVTDGVIDILPDQQGGLYITGKLHDRMKLGRDKLKLDQYEEDCYLTYLDSLGEFQWGRQISGTHGGGNALAAGPGGNIWVSGFFSDVLTLGSFEEEDTLGNDNCYIAEFDPKGNHLWHTILRGGSAMGYFQVRNLVHTGELIIASGHKPRKVMFGDIELPRDSRYYNAYLAAFRL